MHPITCKWFLIRQIERLLMEQRIKKIAEEAKVDNFIQASVYVSEVLEA